MNSTLAYLRGRRTWLVENFAVWGSDSEAEFRLALAERVNGETRIGFWMVSLGGEEQSVSFASLVDNRGNHLPPVIKKPAVVVMPRGRCTAFVKSPAGESNFSIARSGDEATPVTVDLLVVETGL